uniref:Conopeptide n=1 Tax=Conus lenavati TaxID=1519839 RepID=A0A0K8TUV7_CONLV
MQLSVMLVVLLLTMPLVNSFVHKNISGRKAVVPKDHSALYSQIQKRPCPAGCRSCNPPGTCQPSR